MYQQVVIIRHVLFNIYHNHIINQSIKPLKILHDGWYYQPNENIMMSSYATIRMISCGDMHDIIICMIALYHRVIS